MLQLFDLIEIVAAQLALHLSSSMSDHDQSLPSNHRAQSEVHSANDIDDLFDYDVGLDEVLNSISTEPNRAGADAIKETSASSGPSLGLDEEVKVSKKRQPIAKLDETR